MKGKWKNTEDLSIFLPTAQEVLADFGEAMQFLNHKEDEILVQILESHYKNFPFMPKIHVKKVGKKFAVTYGHYYLALAKKLGIGVSYFVQREV